MADPIAVFSQENGRPLFLLDVRVPSGAHVVVPVEFEASQDHATVNLAVTAVPKQSHGKPSYKWLGRFAGKALYVNTEKFASLLEQAGDEALNETFAKRLEELRAASGANFPLGQDRNP